MADEYLKYAIEDYKLQNDQNKLDSVNLESTSEEMTQDFFRTNAVEFQYQQDLWIKASAYARIKSPEEALELLIKNKIAPDKAESILEGTFVPIAPFNDPIVYRLEALDRQTPEFKEAFNQEISESEFLQLKAHEEMQLLSLTNVDNFQFIEEPTQPLSSGVSGINPINTSFLNSNPPLTPKEREDAGLMKKSTGGEVSTLVPNAPLEPDERINKLTGLPYNEEAGPAYMDADDPLRVLNMAAGGRVKDPEDVKFFGGGLAAKALGISDEDLEWAKSQDQRYDPKSKLDGEGDAARHLALGWITQRSTDPKLSLAAANFRENISLTRKDKPMDQYNNNLGATIKADNFKDAEAAIDKLIKENKAMFMTTSESNEMRGYSIGGKVYNTLKRNCS